MEEYAVYKGGDLLAIGTAKECAEILKVNAETIYYYTTDAYKRKLKKRKNPENCRTVVVLDD